VTGLREQLLVIREKRGSLTPQAVVDEARSPDHPLHDRFEWDDAVAGEHWRREQAHELIRSVKVSYVNDRGEHREIRSFHAVRAPAGHVYEPVDTIIEDPFVTKILLQDMEREWRALQARYDRFTEFYAMVQRDLKAS